MSIHGEGIGGVVFLILYAINLCILVYGYTTRLIRFKSVYTFLLLHVILRLAAQSVAIALGTREYLDIGLLIAWFVLGAEGYFSLVLCAYRFLITHHQHTYPTDGSWLEGKPHKKKKSDGTLHEDPWYIRFKRAMTARDTDGTKDPWVMTIIHWVLIGANTIIIVGGTRVNGSDISESDYWDQMKLARIMRAVGQAIFLLINLFLAVFLYLTVRQDRNPNGTLPRQATRFFRVQPDHGAADAHQRVSTSSIAPTVLLLAVAWPPLIVRGIVGLLQALVSPINYAHPDSYEYQDGKLSFTNLFVILENILTVLPEWIACCLLVSTILVKRRKTDDHHELRNGLEEQLSNGKVPVQPIGTSSREQTDVSNTVRCSDQ